MTWIASPWDRLNALSGIGGVQTPFWAWEALGGLGVLMPCRALEAFRLIYYCVMLPYCKVLMPCRALEAFRRIGMVSSSQCTILCLNALSGIGGVQTLSTARLSTNSSTAS